METGERKRAEASEDAVVYGPGSYVIGEDILPGEYAVFTEDTSEHNAYSTCTITLYKMIRMLGASEPSSFSTTD